MCTPCTPSFSQSFAFWASGQKTLHSAAEGPRATPLPVFQAAPLTAGWRVPSSTRSCRRATGWRSPWTVMMRCKLGLFLGPLSLNLPAACFVNSLTLTKKITWFTHTHVHLHAHAGTRHGDHKTARHEGALWPRTVRQWAGTWAFQAQMSRWWFLWRLTWGRWTNAEKIWNKLMKLLKNK